MNVQEILLRVCRSIERNEARIASGELVVTENLRSRTQLPQDLWERIEPELQGFARDMCDLLRYNVQLRVTRDKLRDRMKQTD